MPCLRAKITFFYVFSVIYTSTTAVTTANQVENIRKNGYTDCVVAAGNSVFVGSCF